MIVLALFLFGASTWNHARQVSPATELVSFNFENTDLKAAIKAELGSALHTCYYFGKVRDGKITLQVSKMQYEEAFQEMLSLYGLTYRTEGGIFEIIKSNATKPRFRFEINKQQEISLIDCYGSEIQTVLKSFKKISKDNLNSTFEVNPDVHGLLRGDFHHLETTIGLEALLNTVGATYRVSGGVREIIMREDESRDPTYDIQMSRDGRKVSFEITDAQTRPLLFQMMKKFHKSFTMSPGIGGFVSVTIRNKTLDEALNAILDKTGVRVSIGDGIYSFADPSFYSLP